MPRRPRLSRLIELLQLEVVEPDPAVAFPADVNRQPRLHQFHQPPPARRAREMSHPIAKLLLSCLRQFEGSITHAGVAEPET